MVAPSNLPTTGTVQVQLTTPTGTSIDYPLIMNPAVPGIFLVTVPSNPAANIAVAQFANTVWLVVPTSAATALQIPQNCTASNANPLSICGQPAAPGDYLVLYLTGLGEVTPNGAASGTPLATGVDCARERKSTVRDNGYADGPNWRGSRPPCCSLVSRRARPVEYQVVDFQSSNGSHRGRLGSAHRFDAWKQHSHRDAGGAFEIAPGVVSLPASGEVRL